uniref:MSTP120 n=1 Tax=Homo sapiens TaxID=9606 RepID=Q7Z2S4_HUMAN|nr:MSTP120 [Homo sapiens]
MLVLFCFISLIKVQCTLCHSSVGNRIPLKSWPCKIQLSFNIHAFVPLRKYFLSFFVLQNYNVIQGVYRLVIKGSFLCVTFFLYSYSIFKQ